MTPVHHHPEVAPPQSPIDPSLIACESGRLLHTMARVASLALATLLTVGAFVFGGPIVGLITAFAVGSAELFFLNYMSVTAHQHGNRSSAPPPWQIPWSWAATRSPVVIRQGMDPHRPFHRTHSHHHGGLRGGGMDGPPPPVRVTPGPDGLHTSRGRVPQPPPVYRNGSPPAGGVNVTPGPDGLHASRGHRGPPPIRPGRSDMPQQGGFTRFQTPPPYRQPPSGFGGHTGRDPSRAGRH